MLNFSCHLLLLFQFIQILAAVAKISYSTVGMKLIQEIQVNIWYENHLGIRCCLWTLAIVRKSKVARGEQGAGDANIVQAVKRCYKIKIGFRDLDCCFCGFSLRCWPYNIQEKPLFHSNTATVGMGKRLFCMITEAVLEWKSGSITAL